MSKEDMEILGYFWYTFWFGIFVFGTVFFYLTSKPRPQLPPPPCYTSRDDTTVE